MLAAQVGLIWVQASPWCLFMFQVRVEECDDPAAGIVRGAVANGLALESDVIM
jgi:hypothetical protein